ncbi:unnamed protein product [Camellia sinensis]
MQCDARSSVADAKAELIFELEDLEFSAAATAANAAASPATERAAWIRAFSTRALSFFFRLLLLESLNHLPNDPVLRALKEFTTLHGCNKAQTNKKRCAF